MMNTSTEKLERRYQYLSINWVGMPPKVQIKMQDEMRSIKETLTKRKAER
ncbi:hypothetical protein AB4254_08365 [Vibrio breoganii]